MKVHELKCWPLQFQDVQSGIKPHEVRKNDRNYERGDVVILREFIPGHMVGQRISDVLFRDSEYGFKYEKAGYTGAVQGPFLIGYVTAGGPLPDGWCAFELVAS